MNLTDEQIAQIEEYAGLFLNADEIAILIEVNMKDFIIEISNKESTAYTAYFRGKTKAKKEIRANVVKMAKHGSPQAEELVDDYIIKQGLFERRNHEQ